MDRREELAEVAVKFHGLAMNGGFLQALAVTNSPLDLVVEAFDLLRLHEAADLVRASLALVHDDDVAAELEGLGERYTDLVSDDLLGERIATHATPRKRLPRLPRSVPEMLAEYVDSLVEHEAATDASQTARANRLFVRNHEIYRHLRLTDEGRDAIWALRDDPRPKVRQAAITHSLPYHADEAVPRLEAIAAAGSFEATMVLKGWRAGTLTLD